MKLLLKVLLDGQAWLYANQLKLQAEFGGQVVSETQFQSWYNEWKENTMELLNNHDEA